MEVGMPTQINIYDLYRNINEKKKIGKIIVIMKFYIKYMKK